MLNSVSDIPDTALATVRVEPAPPLGGVGVEIVKTLYMWYYEQNKKAVPPPRSPAFYWSLNLFRLHTFYQRTHTISIHTIYRYLKDNKD